MKSICAALHNEIDKNNIICNIFSQADSEWKLLNAEQYDSLIINLSQSCNLDYTKGWDKSQPLLDIWGNRFEIEYRRTSGQYMEVVIISKGQDGIRGTKDDIGEEGKVGRK